MESISFGHYLGWPCNLNSQTWLNILISSNYTLRTTITIEKGIKKALRNNFPCHFVTPNWKIARRQVLRDDQSTAAYRTIRNQRKRHSLHATRLLISPIACALHTEEIIHGEFMSIYGYSILIRIVLLRIWLRCQIIARKSTKTCSFMECTITKVALNTERMFV